MNPLLGNWINYRSHRCAVSAVLRKKISAAGGISPKLLQCEPLWGALMAAAQRWAAVVYGDELAGRVIHSQMLSGVSAQRQLSDGFAFVPLTKTTGPLLAVAIDRPGAARYAALRLHQPTENLLQAADLFLKLMCEKPAKILWHNLQEALQQDGRDNLDPAMGDASASDAVDPESRVAQVTVAMAAEGSEDGWLLEGGDEPPEIQLYFDLKKLEAMVSTINAKTKAKTPGAGAHDRAALRSRIRQSSVRLDAVIDAFTLSVGEASRLSVGDVLPLSNTEGGQLTLCAETMTGQGAIATGEMGNWKGQRALKLNGPVVDSFLRELVES